jgi:hypothetical protein
MSSFLSSLQIFFQSANLDSSQSFEKALPQGWEEKEKMLRLSSDDLSREQLKGKAAATTSISTW